MKRCLGALLALIMFCAYLPAPAALAEADAAIAAEEAQVVEADGFGEDSERSEALSGGEVQTFVDIEAAEAAGSTGSAGLVMDLGDATVDDVAESNSWEDDDAALNEATVPGAVTDYDYSRVNGDGAPVYDGAEDNEIMARVGGGAVVLLTGAFSGERAGVVFNTDNGVVTGWMNDSDLTLLTDAEKLAYLEAAAAVGADFYEEDTSALLMPVACAYPDGEDFDDAPDGEETEDDSGEDEEDDADGEPEAQAPAEEEDPDARGEYDDAEEAADELAYLQNAAQTVGEAENRIIPSFAQAQMAVGATRTIEVRDVSLTRLPADLLTFASSDPAVATVDGEGVVTGVALGEAYITVTYAESQLSCTVWVQVVGAPYSLTASPAARTVGVGERYCDLRPVFPVGTAAEVTYASSDPEVAKVDSATGVIIGKKTGKAIITLTASNGLTAECEITVMKAPSKVTLNAESATLAEGGRTCQLSVSVPKDTTAGVLAWSSDNPDVATVDDTGLVTSVEPGEATITVKTYNGVGSNAIAETCSVNVTAAPARAYFNDTNMDLLMKDTATPEYTVLDASGAPAAGDPTFRVVSASPAGCVSVNAATGAVKGLEAGSAVIAFSTYNDMAAENTVQVTVRKAVKKIKLKAVDLPTTGYLAVGQRYDGWKVSLSPANAYENVTFTSSKPSVLKVVNAKTGVVEGVKPGTATITVKSHNGKKSKVKVVVRKAPTRVAISPAKAVLKLGKTGKYSVNLYGAGGSYSIESSDPSVATVSADGKVTTKSEGTTTITVRTEPSGKVATSTLIVRQAVVPGLPAALYSNTTATTKGSSNADKLEYVIFKGQSKAGCKYVYGGGYGNTNASTFDCSGFTYWCFRNIGVTLGASAYKQGNDSRYQKIPTIGELKRGDVVCFHRDIGKGKTATEAQKKEVSHVGIYLGSGYFIHASSSGKKVMVSQFKTKTTDYYQRCFSWGRRILN